MLVKTHVGRAPVYVKYFTALKLLQISLVKTYKLNVKINIKKTWNYEKTDH